MHAIIRAVKKLTGCHMLLGRQEETEKSHVVFLP